MSEKYNMPESNSLDSMEGIVENNEIESFVNWRESSSDQINEKMVLIDKAIEDIDSLDLQVDKILALSESERYFLGDFKNDKEVIKALILNLLSVKGKTRKSGRLYSSHPVQVGVTILETADDLSEEIKKDCLLASFTHDFVEEGYMENSQEYLNDQFAGKFLGNKSIILMEPELPNDLKAGDEYTTIYSHMAEQLKMNGDPSIVNVEISDRLEDLLDLDYILKSNKSPEQKKDKITKKIAKAKFTIDYITEGNDFASKQLLEIFYETIGFVIKDVSEKIGIGLTEKDIEQEYKIFSEYLNSNRENVREFLNEYLKNKSIL